jgi:hypothetical protein
MVDTAKMQADARLDRRAKHLAAITPHVPVFVCRNLLILADGDWSQKAYPATKVNPQPTRSIRGQSAANANDSRSGPFTACWRRYLELG